MATFEMPWRTLAPGWRWVIWGVGAAIAAGPLAWKAATSGLSSVDGVLGSMLLGVPAFLVYILLLCSKRRGAVFAVLCLLGVLAGLLLSYMGHASLPSYGPSCQSNLKQVGLALMLYSEREGCYPEVPGRDFLARLYLAGDCPDLRAFLCPESGHKAGTGFATDYVANPAVAGRKVDAQDPSAFPVVWESKLFHTKGRKRCVLFMDGSVRTMSEAAFQAMLARLSRGETKP